ncbi:MAG: hypothetical protein COA69_10820 [Robiginitomaculum sp.]|nr:MAG: hypothetical protein COA69_10820 [Robiginitomaculum sp.]
MKTVLRSKKCGNRVSSKGFAVNRQLPVNIAVSVFAVCIPGVGLMAQAQTPPTASEAEQDQIIVTARRREELLFEVPISMTVISGEEIAARGANDLRDLEFAVPNISFNGVDNNVGPEIAIRGIGSDARNIGFETGVAVYVDGVFTGRPSSYNFDLLDVERLEVLRGPQGTLFGKNATAGVINVTTHRPGDELRGMAELQYGNYDHFIVRGSVSGPLSPTVSAGVGGFRRSRGGYQTNTLTGEDLYTDDSWGGRAQLRFRPRADLDILLSADVGIDDYIPNINELEPGSFGFSEAPNNREASVDAPVFQTRDMWGTSLSVDYELTNSLALTSITGYRSTDTEFLSDGDGTSSPFLTSNFVETQEQLTQEVRLSSHLGGSVEFTAGFFFLWQDVVADRISAIPPNTLVGPTGIAVTLDATVETINYAPFAEVDINLTDALSFTAGLRYSHVKKDIDMDLVGSPAFNIITLSTQESRSDDALSFTFGPSYLVSENVNIYARISRGFKAGGFNADFVSSSKITFDSETVTNYESGLKFVSDDNRHSVNIAAFYMDYRNLQVIRFEQLAGFIITNAGSADIYGVEVDAHFEPFDGLSINAAVGYLDATFASFKDAGGPGIDFDGNSFANAPHWTFSTSAQYEHALASGSTLFIRGEYSHRASNFSRTENDPNSFIDGFGLLNARVGYRFLDDSMSIEFWTRNLADKEYINDRGTPVLGGLLGQTARNFGAPRTYGIRLAKQF